MTKQRLAMQLGLFGIFAVVLSGCGFFRDLVLSNVGSEQVLHEFNTSAPVKLAFRPLEDEVAEIVSDQLPDAYWSFVSNPERPTDPAWWLHPVRAAGPITDAVACVLAHPESSSQTACFDALFAALGMPPPTPIAHLDRAAWHVELDAIRVQVNLKSAVRAVATFYATTQVGPLDGARAQVLVGVRRGLERFQAYQTARSLDIHRDEKHPVSTIVMAGGAANGAFSAGAMWFLLQRLDACKKADEAALARCAENGCSDEERRRLETDSCAVDRLQMAAGASTGALISLVAKDYFAEAPGRRQRALDRIFQSYTCSVNSDLYCTTDSNLKELTQGEAKGLVRFDGLDRLLRGYIDQYTLDSPTEYFSSTVDFRTGRTLHLSSKDPEDVDDVHDLRQAVLSSVVEPGLSEPIFRIGEKQGVFIDGGVRSGLPMLTPLLRGAERAVVFVNAPLEPRPLRDPQRNGGEIALRMLDLFVHQPIVGELHEAEYRLAVKRLEELQLCVDRLQSLYPTRSEGEGAEQHLVVEVAPQHLEDLCAQRLGPDDPHVTEAHDHGAHPHPEGEPAAPQAVSPPAGPNLGRAYRPLWLFQPHQIPSEALALEPGMKLEELSAAGYQFDPKLMWKLFVFGAAVAHRRCAEVSDVLGWHLEADGRHFCDGASLAEVLGPMREQLRFSGCWRRKSEPRVCQGKPLE